jgi:hypothetical protein
MKKQLTFIASGGRTGTQFFGDILGQIVSDCHSEHEPDMVAGLSRLTLQRVSRFGLWHMCIGRLLGRTGIRVLGQSFLEGQLDAQTCIRRLRAGRDNYHAAIPQTLIVESYYAWWMVADQIESIWPDAKLAGILRDPRDWIASWLRHASNRRNGALTETLPPGPLHPAKVGDAKTAAIWDQLDQVGKLAWEWRMIATHLDVASRDSPNVRVFRFEDLFEGDVEQLSDFVQFATSHQNGPSHHICNLASIRETKRNSSSGTAQSWQDWNDAQVAAVSYLCGPVMDTYGYGKEPEWQMRVRAAGPFRL